MSHRLLEGRVIEGPAPTGRRRLGHILLDVMAASDRSGFRADKADRTAC